MSKKAPGFYKKSINHEDIEKQYLRYIEHDSDKSFIRSAYTEQDSFLVIRTDFEKEDIKRLKTLMKAIKKNRKGAINVLPIAVIAILAAGVVYFFTVMLNPLLQNAMETGLESVFEAKVNAANFRMDIFNFSITMDGLTIADRDSPMQNLIQFNKLAIRLKSEAVLRGKIYIEEIRADAIRFATPRTVSGALPGKPPKVQKEKDKIEIPVLVDLQNFDAMALLNREYEKLRTPKLYDDAINAYNAASAKWNGQIDIAKRRYNDLESRARPFLALNINDYRTLDQQTIEKIRDTINEINALVNSVQEAGNEVGAMVTGVQQDLQTAVALEQNARNMLTTDLAYLKSFLDLSSGPAVEIVESIIQDILTGTAYTYLAYGERALEVLEKVKEMQAKLPKNDKPVKIKEVKFQGRDVIFPVYQYPQFYMGVLATDVYTPGNWHWNFDLRGVSSDPDLSGTPVNLLLSMDEGGNGRKAGFKGMADFRTRASQLFNTELSGSGFSVSLGDQLSAAGIGGYTGNASFTVNLAGFSTAGFSGSGSVSLLQSKLIEPANTLAQAVDEAIRGVSAIDLGVKFENAAAGNTFNVNTNIGDLVLTALKNTAARYIKQAEDEIEKILREKISSYVDESIVSKEELDMIFAAVRGDKAAVDLLKNSLDNKKNEFEQRLRAAADEAIRQATEEVQRQVEQYAEDAQRQGEQAVQDILQGNTPTINLPSAPSLPSIPNLPSNPFNR